MIYGDSGIVRRNAKKSPEAVEHLNFSHPYANIRRERGSRGENNSEKYDFLWAQFFLPFDLSMYLVLTN